MRYSIVGPLLCYAAAVEAFRDTSPFFLFSTSELPSSLQIKSQELDTASSVLQSTKEFLSTCPSDAYLILQQPALAPSDFSSPAAVPYLKAAISDSRVRTSYSVSNVMSEGENLAEELIEHIQASCGKKVERSLNVFSASKTEGVSFLKLSPVSTEEHARAEEFNDQDSMLNEVYYKYLPDISDYTIIYTTTPLGFVLEQDEPEPPVYHADFDATAHFDLKRDFEIRANKSKNATDTRPLFEKYQYFTPGIFMGLVVGIILLSILFVGLNAVSSLQVSYGAFDKEMGPSAQRKQQ